MRKPQTCRRCKTTKYTSGVAGEGNHKKRCCADGVKVNDPEDPPPRFPQPDGVYTDGMYLDPLRFLAVVHEINRYQVSAVESGTPLQDVVLPMELASFKENLKTRRLVRYEEDGTRTRQYFRLYKYLTCSPPCLDLIETHDGVRYLRLDCLFDD